MRNPAVEARLLASIAERGIQEALEGVEAADGSILLNGFKRYRCASKLRIRMAPYASLGEDEAAAILNLLLHVHLAAVHAHERSGKAGRRRLRGGAGRQEV